MIWKKKGFEEFRKGTFGNSGQNIYVSAKGVLQRIFNFDVNGDGYFDLPIANSHSMWEMPPIHIYNELGGEPLELPTHGSFDAIFADLNGDGTDDLIVACQHNGVHNDVSAIIYFGSEMGLTEKYCQELRVPNSFGVVAGDFTGSGKLSLLFISGNELRIFNQINGAFGANIYDKLPVSAVSVAVGDLDGDGYDDLYVFHQGTGELAVYWGGSDGLQMDRKTVIGKFQLINDHRANSTTAGRKLYHWVPWKTAVLEMGGKPVTFRADENYAVFESFDENRNPVEIARIKCNEPVDDDRAGRNFAFAGSGPMHATSGDLRGDGSRDVVIAVATDFNNIEDTIVLWEKDNYDINSATKIPVRAARSLSVCPMTEGGKNYLFVTQASTDSDLDVDNGVFEFDGDGKAKEVCRISGHEATKIMTGRTYTDGRRQLAVINHEGETKLGLEDVWIYLGGEDGFNPERRIELPGCAAVECMPIDVNDDGKPEIIVVNCAENAPSLDPGTAIYYSVDGEFSPENVIHLNTLVSHGCAVGDFRKTGYLDLIFSAIYDRKLTVIEGGPDGFSREVKRIILGDHPEEARPRRRLGHDEEKVDYTQEEIDRMVEFGNPRWIFAADFNNDGWLDLFVPQITGSQSMILWGGAEGFSYERRQDLNVDGVVTGNAADLNGNGYLDLICSGFYAMGKDNEKESYTTIYWGSEDGFSENRKTQLPAFSADDLTINDFNGDGKLDIFSAAYNGGRSRDVDSRIFFGNDEGYFSRNNIQLIRTHSGAGALSGDFNGDGYIDLAVANHKKEGNHVCGSKVYWGGEDGINEERFTLLPSIGPHGMTTVDVGNIADRSNSEYYYSEVYEAPEGMKAVKVSWIAENGKRTWVKAQFRCGETVEKLNNDEWSESFENGADISALNLKGYVQYRLELGAYCGTGTPRVTEVNVEFE